MKAAGKISALLRIAFTAVLLSSASSSAAIAQVDTASSRQAVEAAVSSLNLQTEIPKSLPAGRGGTPLPSDQGGSANFEGWDGRLPPDAWDWDSLPDDWDGSYSPEARDGMTPPEGRDKNYSPDNSRKSYRPLSLGGPIVELIAQLFLWGSVAVIVIIIFMALRDNWRKADRSRRLERREAPEMGSTGAEAWNRMGQAQADADELARKGLFAEAMHILLLQSVSEMRRRLDVTIAASLTSREILNRVGLSPEGRTCFADIIGRVEISYFGIYKPGVDEYTACRRSFEMLSGTLGREAGR